MAEKRVLGGRYRLLSTLGRGGMGEVWKAHDELLDRLVAVKLILPQRVDTEEVVARFRREAQLTARLGAHPNVVTLYDFDHDTSVGEQDGAVYAVMELVPGRSLNQVLRETGPMPLSRAALLISQAAAGLGAAHAAGIVHRDVKPGNLMVVEEGSGADTLKVLDFGIAVFTAASRSRRLTQTGQIVGTPLYMPPEQIRGEPGESAGDLYSLGAILHLTLTGRPPFSAEDHLAVLRMHLVEEPVPVTDLRPDVPPGLAALVGRMLAKRPEERPVDAEEVRERLAPFLPGPTATEFLGRHDRSGTEVLDHRDRVGTEVLDGEDRHVDTVVAPEWDSRAGHRATPPAVTRVETVLRPTLGETRIRETPEVVEESCQGPSETKKPPEEDRTGTDDAGRTDPPPAPTPPPTQAHTPLPAPLRTRMDSAQARSDAGQYVAAARELGELLPRLVSALGPDHPDTLRARRRKAYAIGKGGQHLSAAQQFGALVDDLTRAYGASHPETLTARYYQATNAGRAGQHALAARVHTELLPDLTSVHGADSSRVLTTRLHQAFEIGEAGDPYRAVELLDSLVPDIARALGEDDPATLRAHHYRAAYTGHAGNPNGAARLYHTLLAHHTRLFGAHSSRTARIRRHLHRWQERSRR